VDDVAGALRDDDEDVSTTTFRTGVLTAQSVLTNVSVSAWEERSSMAPGFFRLRRRHLFSGTALPHASGSVVVVVGIIVVVAVVAAVVVGQVISVVDKYRSVALGRFEAFQSSNDLSLWYRKAMADEAAAAAQNNKAGVPAAARHDAFAHGGCDRMSEGVRLGVRVPCAGDGAAAGVARPVYLHCRANIIWIGDFPWTA
jgi:hypothetical protein